MVVIQLESLDEAGVQQGRRRAAGSPPAPAAQGGIPGVVERRYPLDANTGDGQLRTYESTADAVKYQVLGSVADGGGNVVERCFGDPGGKPTGRTGRGCRGTAGSGHGGGAAGKDLWAP